MENLPIVVYIQHPDNNDTKGNIMAPKKVKQGKIATKAQGILEETLADYGVLNKFVEDYGIDYEFELIDTNGAVNGKQIHIQLKGQEKVKISNGFVQHYLDKDHVNYYLNRDPLPTFLVIIDVNNRTGYWLHLQKYLIENKINIDSTANIRFDIPARNILANITVFKREIEESMGSMLTNTARIEEIRLRETNPGYEFKINLENGVKVVKVKHQPTPVILVDDIFKENKSAKADFLMGKKVTFRTDTYPSYIPFKLPSARYDRFEISLYHTDEFQAFLRFRIRTNDGQMPEICFIGNARKGPIGLYFRGKQMNGPFSLEAELNQCDKVRTCGNLSICYNFFPWASFPAKFIPEFCTVGSFLGKAILPGSEFNIIFQSENESVKYFETSFQIIESDLQNRLKFIFSTFDLIKLAKLISEKLGINPELKTITQKIEKEIIFSYHLYVKEIPFGSHVRVELPQSQSDEKQPIIENELYNVVISNWEIMFIGQRFSLKKALMLSEMRSVISDGNQKLCSTEKTTMKILENFPLS